jgi:hypothetical protein
LLGEPIARDRLLAEVVERLSREYDEVFKMNGFKVDDFSSEGKI